MKITITIDTDDFEHDCRLPECGAQFDPREMRELLTEVAHDTSDLRWHSPATFSMGKASIEVKEGCYDIPRT